MRTVAGREFPAVLQAHQGPFIALFYAQWCRFCRRFEPVYTRFAEREPLEFLTVDISDENDPLWEEYQIAVVPCLLAFRDGTVIARRDGLLGVGLGEPELAGLLADVHRLTAVHRDISPTG